MQNRNRTTPHPELYKEKKKALPKEVKLVKQGTKLDEMTDVSSKLFENAVHEVEDDDEKNYIPGPLTIRFAEGRVIIKR